MASTFTGSTLMVVVAGYAFGWSRRSDRYMCHRRFGLAFGFGFIWLECAPKGGYTGVIAPYDAGGVVSGVSGWHVASIFSPVESPALSYFSHLFLLVLAEWGRGRGKTTSPTRSPTGGTGGRRVGSLSAYFTDI